MTVITLPFPPSTNNMYINTSGGRIRSQKYADWAVEAGWEIARQRPSKVAGPVILRFELQEGHDKRKRDLSNLFKATEDLLVKHGIIEGDHGSIVRRIEGSWNTAINGVRVTIEAAA